MHQTPLYIILFQVLHAQRAKSGPYRDCLDLSPGQPKLLRFLSRHGECLQKELATGLDLEPGTVSKLLNPLEDNGLITRSSIPGDKRATRISITDEGKRIYLLYSTYMEGLEQGMMQGFSEEQKEVLKDLLCRVYHNLTGRDIS